jgi:hypothetical protein
MPTHAQIVWREGLGVVHQRERFASALVRPLVWLFNLRRWPVEQESTLAGG